MAFFEQKLLSRRKVNKETNCWEWTGAINSAGVGVFVFEKVYHTVHRVAAQLWLKTYRSNLFVCHKCDNPCCFNPVHLFMGTAQDNSNDMIRKNRKPTKLKESNIQQIREFRKQGKTQKWVADYYSIKRETISKIDRGIRWNHVS